MPGRRWREERRQKRKAQRAAEAAAEAAVLLQAAVQNKSSALQWNLFVHDDDVAEEDRYILSLRVLKAAAAPASVVDVQDWNALEVWMRDMFEVESSVKKLILKGVVRLDGDGRREHLRAVSPGAGTAAAKPRASIVVREATRAVERDRSR